MELILVLASLLLLMYVAYKGHSVILFAPLVAMLAVLLTNPADVPTAFTGLFMEKMVGFVKLYLPVFLLGAIFGKVIELSGFSKSIVRSVIRFLGPDKSILSIVLVCALLTYGGVSLFVVVFAVYPFASEMFKQSQIPKRLIPGTIALGAFTFTMDSFPGSPQIQNIIPTTFFGTDTWAAPILGLVGGCFVLLTGYLYLRHEKRKAQKINEGYGVNHINEPEIISAELLPAWWLAILPLIIVGVSNKVFASKIISFYGPQAKLGLAGLDHPIEVSVTSVAAIWSIQAALLIGIITVLLLAHKNVFKKFAEGSKQAIAGALIAALNTASEYGFGAVIAALPGFLIAKQILQSIPNVLVNEAVTVTTLAGMTGSASGGLSIALAAMSQQFIQAAQASGIPMEVLHRVASMASGGMDTLPHNGAVITLFAVTGLTHKQSYKDIFAITCLKTLAVFVVIGFYYLTGLV